MRRTSAFVLVVGVIGGLLALAPLAEAHQCPEPKHEGKPKKNEACHETEVYEDWRPNHVPLFDLPSRDDPEQEAEAEQERRDAQRWREECADGDQERQYCAWLYGGSSGTPYEDTDEGQVPRPNEVHVGFAANHCFLLESQHDCDAHQDTEDTHDSHGGAIYVDVCLAENSDSRHCDDGVTDTQAGVTIVDHLSCPGCFDEYHVIRPLDGAYTGEQMADSAEAVGRIVADPRQQVCGYHEDRSDCPE